MTLKKMFEKVNAYNEIAEMMCTRKAEIHFYLRDVICFGDHFDSFESLRKYIRKEYTKELADAVLNCSDWELDKEIEISYTDYFGSQIGTFCAELVAA